jgi:hypothetical protein
MQISTKRCGQALDGISQRRALRVLSNLGSMTVGRGLRHAGTTRHEADAAADPLDGRDWDVCIDNPTLLLIWVRSAVRVLKGHVGAGFNRIIT